MSGFITHKRRSTRQPEQAVNTLAFADDVACLENSIEMAQKQLDALASEAAKVGLYINTEKTEYLTYNIPDPTPLQLDGEALKMNDNFKYLGSMMKDCSTDLAKRRGQALGAFYKMKNLWNNDSIPIELKIKIYKVSVLSIFLYGFSQNMTKNK